jgi:putative transposase
MPVLIEHIETRVHNKIKNSVLETADCIFHEIGGTEGHVHLAVSIPPTLTISEWIGKLKGASSYYINQEIANRKLLEWQSGYGVVSFKSKDLPWIVEYIRNQKEHHSGGKTYERLERIDREETAG